MGETVQGTSNTILISMGKIRDFPLPSEVKESLPFMLSLLKEQLTSD